MVKFSETTKWAFKIYRFKIKSAVSLANISAGLCLIRCKLVRQSSWSELLIRMTFRNINQLTLRLCDPSSKINRFLNLVIIAVRRTQKMSFGPILNYNNTFVKHLQLSIISPKQSNWDTVGLLVESEALMMIFSEET